MRMKSVLLGSAAALGFGGAAQAADLGVPFEAEPVDYVRVCDAFGTGYYYIPGTDTCLKISGFVRFDVEFYDPDEDVSGHSTDSHFESYKFKTVGGVTFEARSQTDWGPLVGVINIEGEISDPNDGKETAAFVDDVLLSLGPLYAGYTGSLFDQVGGGYGMIGLDDGYGGGVTGPYTALTDDKVNTIGLNWAFNGFGLAIALEDNRFRANDWFQDGAGVSNAGSMPDLVAALFGEWGNIGAGVSFLYMDTDDRTIGVQGYVEVVDIFGSDSFILGASYIDEDQGVFSHEVFSLLASYQHFWTANLSSAISARYDDWSCGCGSGDNWAFEFDTSYEPVNNLDIRGAVVYRDAEDSWEGRLRLQRNFGD